MNRTLNIAALLMLTGCYAATRSTVDLGRVERKLAAAKAADAHLHAVYAWTMAHEYTKKARDEWGHSDYEAAEAMMKKAGQWADQALQQARLAPKEEKWGTEQLQDEAETPADHWTANPGERD
jgi:hypothetical protein